MSKIPAAFEKILWSTVPDSPIKSVGVKYLAEFPGNIAAGLAPVFLGRAGTWKTSVALLVAQELERQVSMDYEFVSVPEVRPKFEFNTYSDQVTHFLCRWATVPLLILDDFAVAEPGSRTTLALEATMATRYNALLPTIWTGNLALPKHNPFDGIADRYGALFSRRLQERATGYTVLID
jgi:DNA replication protein DnaC